ncbi:MAG TPA: hypothetical protein VEA69_07010 [Tepidisphaeraceae bacterium]|nr:hypothetical protein [Tepidisphaeraceae bacterium]
MPDPPPEFDPLAPRPTYAIVGEIGWAAAFLGAISVIFLPAVLSAESVRIWWACVALFATGVGIILVCGTCALRNRKRNRRPAPPRGFEILPPPTDPDPR